MKKILLPLIFILLLTFISIGDCWVSGYDQRVKLTTDNTKIDATLSNFPVTAFFTAAQGEEIFAEFDADEDFDRGQFALGDDTLLKAEKELFDHSESLGIYHFKATELSSSVGTDIYFYYDNDADHNTSYIGIIGSVTAAEVWDEWFSLVVHGVDNTTSSVLDSTSNNNDGTKGSANNPLESSGKVGVGQLFDAAEEYITLSGFNVSSTITVESIIVIDTDTLSRAIATVIEERLTANNDWWFATFAGKPKSIIWQSDNSSISTDETGEAALTVDTLYYITMVGDGNNLHCYVNNSAYGTSTAYDGTIHNLGNGGYFGKDVSANRYFGGTIDETRVSDTNRSAAWIKATHNSLWDDLLTYGSEETEAKDNAIFFGINQ